MLKILEKVTTILLTAFAFIIFKYIDKKKEIQLKYLG